jgi:hypothetical protein
MRGLSRAIAIFFIAFPATQVIALAPSLDSTDTPVPATTAPPVVDGTIDDSCWSAAGWHPIDQVWFPYGDSVPASDFSARFALTWSPSTNLLYVAVILTDDRYVDGYTPGVTSDLFNFDILEVFVDEDRSGGLHVFDGSGDTGIAWGTNAENAFAYHLNVTYPADGETTRTFAANDLAGTGWETARVMNYASHFPAFAVQRTRQVTTWEFSLLLHDSSYVDNDPARSIVTLRAGKRFGLSLAYCDNDDPNESPKTRDNFFGSVHVPQAAWNDHWKDAGCFGAMRLASTPQSPPFHNEQRP